MDIQAMLISLSLLVSVIEVCGSSDEGWSMKVPAEVRAMEGYPAVLPCSFSHPHHTLHSSLKVLWRLGHGKGSRVLFQCSTHSSSSSCQPRPEQDQRYRLEGNPRQHDLSLRITNAALQDVGRYYCRIEVPGQAHASYEDKMGTRLRVEAAPRILGLSVEGNEALGYKALCRVQGSPLPDIQWLGQEELLEGTSFAPLSQDAPGERHTTSQLLDVHPEQQYTCSASNPLGKEQATLYVLSPRPLPAGQGPPLLLLLSVSLGAKLLLLLGTGTWMLLGGLRYCWLKCTLTQI